jgi:membrane-associated phospholipid phosphatase
MRAVTIILVIIFPVFCFFPDISYSNTPYELSGSKDGLILGIGIPLAIGGFVYDRSISPLSMDEINLLKREDVNRCDRFVTYNYSQKAADISDWLLFSCIAAPFTLLSSEKIQNDAVTVYGIYAESLLYGTILPFYGKAGAQRVRPYVYNLEAPMSKKSTAEAKRSFFSGHTAVAFTSMIFFSTVYNSYYPESNYIPFVWTGSLLLASSVGYFRMAAGAHFLTDVLVGAIVGSAIGYLIPRLHEVKESNDDFQYPDLRITKPMFSIQFAF